MSEEAGRAGQPGAALTEVEGQWHRLHPLSPLVRAGRASIALLIVLGPRVLATGRPASSATDFVLLALIGLGGLIAWLVTRWRVDGHELRIESGLIRRSSRRFALSRVQAIDIVRPGLGRIFGLAEVRLRMAGASGGHARLAYLRTAEAETLRARLLSLAQGAPGDAPTADERVLVAVPTGRLVGSILLAAPGLTAMTYLAVAITVLAVDPGVAPGVLGGGSAWLITIYTLVWRRFNEEYKLTVADAPDGLRLRSGLIALSAETIRPGRIQAVRMTEPLLWRPLGWRRLEVDLAGRQRQDGEGEAQSRQLRAVLPVGTRSDADALLQHLVPDGPEERRPAPPRARWKSPLRYRNLSWGRNQAWVMTTSGRVRRVTDWIPLVKAQSLRRIQGPLQRRLRLTSIHVDTAGRSVHATLRDRDAGEAASALAELVDLCRGAREAERQQPPRTGAARSYL